MGPEVYYSNCEISSSSLEQLRNILIFSLPYENVSKHDRQRAEHIKKLEAGSRPSSATREDREVRLKSFKERQNEERQQKLEEMKAQAFAAQKFKEQKEYERRQRLDELRVKEDERRQLVEERKKAINDAERDRLESILKRNQEREARHESKRKNERSSLAFAFGSSTPRVLGPAENASSFWGHRRATSTQNITYSAPPLTRRQSERELEGSKKRATSAGGLESSKVSTPQHPAGCSSGYMGRRRTDLMPTIPTKESLSTPGRKSFLRSPAPSRPSSSLSQQSTSSITSSVILRSRHTATPRRQRPISIAVTGVTHDLKNGNDLKKGENKPPLPKARKSNLGKSQEKIAKRKSIITSPTESLPKAIELPTQSPSDILEISSSTIQMEEIQDVEKTDIVNSIVDNNLTVTEVEPMFNEKQVKEEVETKNNDAQILITNLHQPPPATIEEKEINELQENNIDLLSVKQYDICEEAEKLSITESNILVDTFTVPLAMEFEIDNDQGSELDMSASMSLKPRITTEEEAKAALAERRRLAREEAEKHAELERLRIEEEYKLEIERQQREEELQRQLIEQQRAAEEERLNEAIREVQRREEEEKARREEEQKLKVLKEEAERKAKEENEKQKAELQERLKNEEKEREARRKRVEAIMLRTRGKNNSGNSQTDDKNAENKMNGSKTDVAENGHKNEKDLETIDNIISVDPIKNANTVTTTLSTDDTLNSNNAWQRNSQTDLLM